MQLPQPGPDANAAHAVPPQAPVNVPTAPPDDIINLPMGEPVFHFHRGGGVVLPPAGHGHQGGTLPVGNSPQVSNWLPYCTHHSFMSVVFQLRARIPRSQSSLAPPGGVYATPSRRIRADIMK